MITSGAPRRWWSIAVAGGVIGTLLAFSGASLAGAEPPAVRVVDGFNRPDSGTLGTTDTGQAWTVWAGSWGVSGTKAAPAAGGYSLAVVDSGGSTGSVSAVLAQPSAEFWLVLHASDGANYWRFGRWQSGPYQLQQVANNGLGNPTLSVTASVTPAPGDVIACNLRSPGLGCSVNGTAVVATTDTFNASASRVGFAVWDPSASMTTRFDDLTVADLTVAADLTVGLSDLDPVLTGGTLVWTATIANAGDAPASSTTVALTIPSGLSGASVTSTVGSCTTTTCQLGTLAPGASATVTVHAVAPSQPATVTLTVAASSPGATNTTDDTRSETTTVQAPPPSGVRVVDGFNRPDSGTLGTTDTGQAWTVWAGSWGVSGTKAAPAAGGYSLAVVDSGGSTGSVSAVLAQPSAEFWLVLRASDGANYWRFGRWQSGPYQLQQVANNGLGNPTLSVTASVTPAPGDVIACNLRSPGLGCSVNGTTVVATTDTFNASASRVGFAVWDPSASMTTRFDDLTVADLTVAADLTVGLSDLDPVLTGGTLVWTATIANAGDAPASSTTVALTIPSGLSGASVTSTVGSCTTTTCQLGTLAPGASATVTVHAVAPSQPATVTLTVAASSPGATNTTDDTRSETTTVQAPPPSGVRVVDGFNRPDSGTLGTTDTGQAWTLLHGSASVVAGRARPEPGYTLASVDGGGVDGRVSLRVVAPSSEFWLALRIADGANYWRFGRWQSGPYQLQQIANNGVGLTEVTTTATIAPLAGDIVSCRYVGAAIECSVNGAVVAAVHTGAAGDTRGVGFASWEPSGSAVARFDDLTVTELPAMPDVAVSLSDDDPVSTGGTLRWTATVVNGGTVAANGVTLDVMLPVGVAATSVTSSQGTCTASSSPIQCSLGLLAVNAGATVVVTAVAPPAPAMLTTGASVHAQGDPVAANDDDSETTWVRTPPAPDARLIDSFSRTGSGLGAADSGEPWTVHTGAFATAGGSATATTADLSVAAVEPGWAYGTYELTVQEVGDGRFWAAFRIVDALNYFRVGPDPATGAYRLEKVVNGVAMPVAIAISRHVVTAADGDRIRIVVRPDDGMFVSVNGVHVWDAGDTASMHVGRFGFATRSSSARFAHLEVAQVMSSGVVSADAFERPDSASMGNMALGTHYAWFAHPAWGITAGRAHVLSSTEYGVARVDAASEAADVRATMEAVGGVFGIAFRYDELHSTYFRFGPLQPGGAYDADLVSGATSSSPPAGIERLATVMPAAGDVLEVRQGLDGSVGCYVNGLLVLRFTDTVTNRRSTIYGLYAAGSAARFGDVTIVPE